MINMQGLRAVTDDNAWQIKKLRCFSKLWIAVGNISAGFCCSYWGMDGLLGSPQACPDRRGISWYKHISLCCMVHPSLGCCYDSSGFISLISEISNSSSPPIFFLFIFLENHDPIYYTWVVSFSEGPEQFWLLRCFQGSADPLLAAEALISGIVVSSLLSRICRLRFLRHLYKYDFTIPELNDYLPSSGFQDLLPFHPLRSSTPTCLIGVSKFW